MLLEEVNLSGLIKVSGSDKNIWTAYETNQTAQSS